MRGVRNEVRVQIVFSPERLAPGALILKTAPVYYDPNCNDKWDPDEVQKNCKIQLRIFQHPERMCSHDTAESMHWQ